MREELFIGANWTEEGKRRNQTFEGQYRAIQPYIEQTERWKVGQRYQFCPTPWQLESESVDTLERIGGSIGRAIKASNFDMAIGFRIDMVQGKDGVFKVTEVQTDDRGLPEMAILRNAYGGKPIGTRGVIRGFKQAVTEKFPDCDSLVIVYPQGEEFYYAPFRDFTKFCRAEEGLPQEVWVLDDGEFDFETNEFLRGCYPEAKGRASAVYDFTESQAITKRCFEPVDKRFLLAAQSANTPLNNCDKETLKESIPEVWDSDSLDKVDWQRKEQWVIKPIKGRWSKGVIFGEKASRQEWQIAINQVKRGEAIIQRYIPPKVEWLPVRVETRKGEIIYKENSYMLRIEGYYFLDGDWEYQLEDVMITGRTEMPVHGRRDCIMVPAAVKDLKRTN